MPGLRVAQECVALLKQIEEEENKFVDYRVCQWQCGWSTVCVGGRALLQEIWPHPRGVRPASSLVRALDHPLPLPSIRFVYFQPPFGQLDGDGFLDSGDAKKMGKKMGRKWAEMVVC